MVDSLAPGVARGWRGFRHGGGYRGGKRGPSTLAEKGPGRSGAGEGGRGPKGADLTRWRGSDRACCRSWTTQVEIHYSLLFAAVTILVFSLPFPRLPLPLSLSLSVFLSASLSLTFHTSLSSRFVRSSLPDRVFPFLPLLCLFPSFLFFSFLFFSFLFLFFSLLLSPSFLLFCFARSLESGAGTSRDKRRAPDNGKKWRGSTRSFRIAALCHG